MANLNFEINSTGNVREATPNDGITKARDKYCRGSLLLKIALKESDTGSLYPA